MSGFSFFVFLFITCMLLPASSGGVTYNAVLPRNIKALSGSCVQIPCTYNVSDFENKLNNTERIYGIWLNGTHPNQTLVFNSSQPIIKWFSHIEMLGNVSGRECTTVFYNVMKNHSDVYYFRVQMEPEVFRVTFIKSAVNFVVLDVPNPPKLNDLQSVMENTSVNLICSAEAPCPKQPPTLSWSNIPTSANITTQLQDNPDKTQSVISSMTFNASYTDHRMNISCLASYPRNNSNNTSVKTSIILQVLFPPKETRTIVLPSASVSVGTNVILICKSKANPSCDMNYTWFKRGEQTLLASGEQITFSVSKTSGGWYFCRAENEHGDQKSEEIQLIVKGPLESSVPLIASLIGGFLVLLLLFFLGTHFRRVKKAKASNEPSVGESQPPDQGQEDFIYANSDFIKSVACQRMTST